MKKILLSLIAAIGFVGLANAQVVYGYGVSVNEGSYTEITDGTVIASGTDDALKTTIEEEEEVNNFNEKIIFPSGVYAEETTAAGYPIGFDFMLDNEVYDSFVVSTNGALYLGKGEYTVPVSGRYLFSRDESKNFISFASARGTVCNDDTQISYKLEGEAPARTLTVQFKQVGLLQGYWGTDAYYVDFQIRLYESSSDIEFVVSGMKDALSYVNDEGETEGYTTNVTIGVKGNEYDDTCVVDGTPTEWKKGIGSSNNFEFDNTVADGTTFKFTAPSDVVTPTSQPVNLVVTQYSTKLTGVFSPAENADKYLVVYQEGKEITTLPTDKTVYVGGDLIGEATVIDYYEIWDSTDFEFEIDGLSGATDYTIAIYAVNAFGTNGPAYNTTEPLTVVTYTYPVAPTLFEVVEMGDTTAKINLGANEGGNKVLVVSSRELVRDNYGDYAVVGTLSGEYEVGQEIEGGGKVEYFGDAAEGIELSGLEQSQGYYFVAYSYDPVYGYSSDKIELGAATIGHLPYKLDISLSKTRNNNLPPGWSCNEGSTFEVPMSVNGFTTDEKPYMIWCKVGKGNATDGVVNDLTSCPIMVDQRDAVVKFDYTIYHQPSRFASEAYNTWHESDVFAVQVSTDGETFENLVEYTSANNPQFVYTTEEKTLITFEGELAKYEGQKIWIRIHWHLFNATFVPGTLVIDNFTVEGREIPETPVVKVEDITHLSAKVAWRGAQENYEVAFAKTGEEFTTQVVEGAMELTFTDLDAETEYQVKVRGIAAENDYSYWSEVVTFTTTAWPECAAPTNLVADLEKFESERVVVLSWEGNEEHLTWDVRYRDGNSTSWNTTEGLEETTITLTDLENEVTYLWNVRAACTADRTTSWSAQGQFTTPKDNSISMAEADDLKVYATGNYINVINSGVYVNRIAVYAADGSLLSWVEVDGYDNALIPVNATGVVVVKVECADNSFTYKTCIK